MVTKPSTYHGPPMPDLVSSSAPLGANSTPWSRSLRDKRLQTFGSAAPRVVLSPDNPLLIPQTERSLYSAHEVGMSLYHASPAYSFGKGRKFGENKDDDYSNAAGHLDKRFSTLNFRPELAAAFRRDTSTPDHQRAFGVGSPRMHHNLEDIFGMPPASTPASRGLAGRVPSGSYYRAVPSRHEPPMELNALMDPPKPYSGMHDHSRQALEHMVYSPRSQPAQHDVRPAVSNLPPREPTTDGRAVDDFDATLMSHQTVGDDAQQQSTMPTAGLFGTDTRNLPNPYR